MHHISVNCLYTYYNKNGERLLPSRVYHHPEKNDNINNKIITIYTITNKITWKKLFSLLRFVSNTEAGKVNYQKIQQIKKSQKFKKNKKYCY